MADLVRWGVRTDPHPLSIMKTELVWESEYDEYGPRRKGGSGWRCHANAKDRARDTPRSEASASDQIILEGLSTILLKMVSKPESMVLG